ncbi:disulfide bond formation protein B [Deinococcus psychrotolerans]|uniref:Disulfide bond formation protein B n=1 Tax=Deinococcus psychrotolerans TaxID=2489213 RepID=A0A3G8YEQ4_9DEIO|nr:disulfide bond formation protein B [Deinococcus psychrotolerans]AZI42627.1 disulfide bond formation protein B [Deinococcus psychrotolerans]
MTRDNRLYLAWVVALIATLGSLYFSEIRSFVPCILCWFQRIFMYPLAIILGIAALRGDFGVRVYALSLAAAGWLIALYQNLEVWGVVQTLKACTVGPIGTGCDAKWPIFGAGLSGVSNIITIPVLSLTAFTLIIGLLSWPRHKVEQGRV